MPALEDFKYVLTAHRSREFPYQMTIFKNGYPVASKVFVTRFFALRWVKRQIRRRAKKPWLFDGYVEEGQL